MHFAHLSCLIIVYINIGAFKRMDITQMTANMSQNEPGFSQENNHRRENYISWGDYFMGLALLSAERSKDARMQVGACIVNDDNKIVSLGYNAMPMGRDDLFPWNDETTVYICHAELNAILRTTASDLKGCTIYQTQYPCVECARLIIQSGIKKIYYLRDKTPEKKKYKDCKTLMRTLMNNKNINFENYIERYVPKVRSININFEDN